MTRPNSKPRCAPVAVPRSSTEHPSFAAPGAAPAHTGGDAPEFAPSLARLAELAAQRAAVAAEEAEILADLARLVDIQLAGTAPQSVMAPMHSDAPHAPGSADSRDDRAALQTVKDVARRLAVDAKTVRRWRSEGRLPAALEIGGAVRWRAGDIDTWIAREIEPEDGLGTGGESR